MTMEIELSGSTAARPSSVEHAASEVLALSEHWAELLPGRTSWAVLTSSYEREKLRGTAQIETAIRASVPLRASEAEPRSPTYSAVLFASMPAGDKRRAVVDLVRIEATFCLPGEPAEKGGLAVQTHWSPSSFSSATSTASFFEQAMVRAVKTFGFHCARVAAASRSVPRRAAANVPRVGWFTYLSRSLGSLPSIPSPTRVVPVDDLGWILVSQTDPVILSNRDHRASLAYVRHAMGARVLLDGPSFPPPDAENPSLPSARPTEVPAIAPAPQIPSFMKAPPAASSPSAPNPAQSAPPPLTSSPGPVAPPRMGETSEVDIGKLARDSLPFDRNASPNAGPRGSAEAPKLPTGTSNVDPALLQRAIGPFAHTDPPSEARQPRSNVPFTTETAELKLATLLQKPVPFAPAPSGLDNASPAASPSSPAEVAATPRPSGAFGGTEEFDLATLMKARPPVPFPSPATPAKVVQQPGREASSGTPTGHGRWIRFNPQTGEPLATPYWEELPLNETK